MSRREVGLRRLICDSQVHAPNTPHAGPIDGMEPGPLAREMDAAGVSRCVIVPMVPPGDDASRSNGAAVEMAQGDLARFAVMAPFDLTRPDNASLLANWRSHRGLLGVRLAFLRDPNLSLLLEDRLDWFWEAAEEARVPITLLAPDLEEKLGQVASDHPRLRLSLDHLNLHPMREYDDLVGAVQTLLTLARHDNVAVKASALPCWAQDTYPFTSLHRPIAQVVEAFGPKRVFWGSDLTRLPCTYSECVSLFTEELPFLTEDDKDWVMGRGVEEWLGWEALG
jgi:predicted TIM-barrel fold metal-dependent hydrolase